MTPFYQKSLTKGRVQPIMLGMSAEHASIMPAPLSEGMEEYIGGVTT